jgi:hypothetical protein
MSTAALTLSTFNSARISTLESQIASNNKWVDHLVNISSLHEKHFKAVDHKLDNFSDKLATLMKIKPSTLPMPRTFKTDASSPSAGHRKRSSAWTAIHMRCIPSGKSTPTTSVQRGRLFRLYRFPRARHQDHGPHHHSR